MNISLTPTLESIVQEKVNSGLYNNASEVIREALRLMHEQDKFEAAKLKHLARETLLGFTALERGDVSTKSVAQIADEVRGHSKS